MATTPNIAQAPAEVSHVGGYAGKPPDGTIIIESDGQYVAACQQLRDTKPSAQPLRLWTRDLTHFTWLRSFCGLAAIPCSFQRKTPKLILADAWGIPVPDWLDDATVTAEGLLELPAPDSQPATFPDHLLSQKIAKALAAPALDANNLADIVAATVKPEAQQLLSEHPLLQKCLADKCAAWTENTKLSWVKNTCVAFSQDPTNLWRELTIWALLASYPAKLLEYAVAPHRVAFLRSIPLTALDRLPLNELAQEGASAQIQLLFNDVAKDIKTSKAFQSLVASVSGRLAQEFALLQDLLAARHFQVTEADVRAVREKFKSNPAVSAAKLTTLDRFIVPQTPSAPGADGDWQPEDWIAWSLKEYLPYRAWQIENAHFSPEIEKAASAFSDWYTTEYQSVQQELATGLVNDLTSRRSLIKHDKLSIILLIDCLPTNFWPLMQQCMLRSGFHLHNLQHKFAPLPTYTEVCKPLLASGQWHACSPDYAKIFSERAQSDWPGKQVVYLPNLKALLDLQPPTQETVVVLNFINGDQLLHSDIEQVGGTYQEELHRLFARVADGARDLLDRSAWQEQDVTVYVITDHGATRILKEECATLDSKVIAKLFADEHHRFARIPLAEQSQVPENLWALGYKFKQPFLDEDCLYFIPRGHNTVRPQRPSQGYVHGGATPEEVIVPAATFKAVKVARKHPLHLFLEPKLPDGATRFTFYVQRVVTLRIELQNPNDEPIRITRADVLSPDAEVKSSLLPEIQPGGVAALELAAYFSKAANKNEELVLQITYECAADQRSFTIQAAAEFKSAVTGGFALTDLLPQKPKS